MSTILEGYSLDNFGFYEDEKSFYPVIASHIDQFSDSHNVCSIDIDLSKSSNLDFKKSIPLVEDIVRRGGKILWNIKFNLISDCIDLHFEGHFNILNRGFTSFLEKLASPYLKHTFGVCLFEGSLDLIDYIPWSALSSAYFKEWLEDEGIDEAFLEDSSFQKHVKRVFSINALSEYLHRFSARVYDEAISFVSFDTKNESKDNAKLFQLLSKERFNHIRLILSGHKVPIAHITKEDGVSSFGYMGNKALLKSKRQKPTLGICFPEDRLCSSNVLKEFNSIFDTLNAKNIDYRIFPEYDGMHDWDELEQIVVLSKTLTTHGKRVLQGFCAAMGQVVYYGEKVGLLGEISFDEYLKEIRGRGI